MNYKKYLFVGLLLIGLALAVAACSTPPTPCPLCPAPPTCPTTAACPTCPTAEPCPTPIVAEVPFEQAWANSAHANAADEPFRHWDGDDPQEVPPTCAQCHTPTGYMDYLGADGSAAGVVDAAQPVSNGITCIACHNDAAVALSEVTFPSAAVVSDLGPEARCIVCHYGRASGSSIDNAIATNTLTDTLDTVSPELSFINIHYFAAAATQFGSVTGGGYQYAENRYDGKFQHEAGLNTCISCHDQHTLEIKIDVCKECHTNVASEADLVNIRQNGSLVDYNGNGDVTEGISAEISGLQGLLLTTIQAYGKQVANAPIAYDPDTYPYFFTDTNDNGVVDTDEANSDNGYASWTARLLKAAYNYQLSIKDPGAFAHNAKYVIELLYDSIADLNTQFSTPIDMSALHRTDAGHFAATEEAFRHWDSAGEVPATCSKCHSATGLPLFVHEAAASSDKVTGVTIGQPVSQGFECSTCHDVSNFPANYSIPGVKFPSGAVITFGDGAPANICIECHQGRESTVSVNKAVADKPADTVDSSLSFLNPHYFAAGATLFGTQAKGAYEYDGKTYQAQAPHVDAGQSCVTCHDQHALTVHTELCASCHVGNKGPETIRMSTIDYDGDGNTTEGMYDEITTMEELLYAAIQKYATDIAKSSIVYDPNTYPYFFIDTNADGTATPDETVFPNSYASWTPHLLEAAYNYQWVQKDPGAFAHNGKYIVQILYDSIQTIGGDVTKLTRPVVQTP
jgi:nitrate/TMAO reductase-like tetraheme cytochrome c subunit